MTCGREIVGEVRSLPFDALLAACTVFIPCVGAVGIVAAGMSGRARSRLVFPLAVITIAATGLWTAWLWATLPRPLQWHVEWFALADTHISVGLFVDDLTMLFALPIAGLGALAVLYSRAFLPHYLKGSGRRESLYYAAILLFTAAMLGMVFSPDLVQLYVLWEAADLAAFVLIGLNWQQPEVRAAARKTLLYTATGGVAILLGIILLSEAAGTSSLAELSERGEAIQRSPLAPLALLLLLAGVMGKSAQVPLHVWLPNAMVAPTPVNAYLDSATLVAAGVYLLARLHPIFAGSTLWHWSVTAVGLASIFAGGALALKARDFKRILAYSTTSQLGFIVALFGFGSDLAYFAALFLFLHHGMLKAGLFFVAGCVTYSTGVTAVDDAPGRWRRFSLISLSAVILACSLGGVPPLAGFWMKEVFLESALATDQVVLIVLAVAAGALTLVYMLRFLAGVLALGNAGNRGDTRLAGQRPLPITMLVPPLLLATFTLVSGVLPRLASDALVMPAAHSVLDETPHVEFRIHLDRLLFLSLLALTLGIAAHATLARWRPVLLWILTPDRSIDRFLTRSAGVVTQLGEMALRLQSGYLTRYLAYILLAVTILVLVLGAPGLARDSMIPVTRSPAVNLGILDLIMGLLLLLIAVGTCSTFVLRRLVHVILALSAVGLLIAAFFALTHAPNLGLVQVHVETLVTVLFVTALVRLPRAMHERGDRPVRERVTPWNVALATAGGVGGAWVSWHAIEASPVAPIAPWFNEHAKDLTHASDVVAAILVHFRALDTLGE
ncbi:MAG TPA: hydrogen gas-evolving membrane-bound hydrogenase subunit E, partial [Chloroflexota bacterium]|nr:hydrogen gas-evolving membrane-bound hydrogenase subunit E [Chloroflexota bacterium]